LGIGCEFVQHNQAASTQAGTIRGLHFQISPHAQAKLVRVLRGSLYDAAVDLLTAGAGFTQLTIAGASSGTYHFAGEGVTTWHDF
jgi:dTDP-4-dehydrorhamnose 3,5-epimerase